MRTKEELRNTIRLMGNALVAIEALLVEGKSKEDNLLFQRKMEEFDKLIKEYARRFL